MIKKQKKYLELFIRLTKKWDFILLLILLFVNIFYFNISNLKCKIQVIEYLVNKWYLLFILGFVIIPIIFGKKYTWVLILSLLAYDITYLLCR